MKRALVLDAGQDMGNNLCQVLTDYQWSVTATLHSQADHIPLLNNLTLAEVTSQDHDLLEQLFQQADTVFLHLPESPQTGQMIFSLETILSLSAKYQCHLVITTNQYEPSNNGLAALIKRERRPVAVKLPKKLTRQIKEGTKQGASITVIGCGHNLNFSSRDSALSLFIKESHKQLVLQSPSQFNVPHYWTHLPDLAKNLVHQLTTQPNSFPPCSIHFYPGHQASMKDIARCLALTSGKPVSVTTLHWRLVEIISLFSPLLRRLLHMRQLWQQGGLRPEPDENWNKQCPIHTPLELAVQRGQGHTK